MLPLILLPLIWAVLAADKGDLLERLQRRDPQALAELYDLYGGMVFRFILRIVRDSGIAEDLVQETFLRVWNRAGMFDSGRGAVGAWLLTVARNRAIDYLRYLNRRTEASLDLNETEHPALFADMRNNPADFDLARHLKKAMEQLNPQQREAIELAYFEGMSQTEIAQRMAQPLGTVKTWMRRALQQMREALGGAMTA
jgi:RNA polymerase sigma-70 factor, ECF subfamily